MAEEAVGVCFFCFDEEERVFYAFQEGSDLLFRADRRLLFPKVSVYLVVSLPGVACIRRVSPNKVRHWLH